MSAQEVGRNHNKNLFMVQIWHERSVAPFCECISHLLMLQASREDALKLTPSQGALCGFFLTRSPCCSMRFTIWFP